MKRAVRRVEYADGAALIQDIIKKVVKSLDGALFPQKRSFAISRVKEAGRLVHGF